MTTFNTANSSSTYSVGSNADVVEITVRGGTGGDGDDKTTSGKAGGAGGVVQAVLPVSGGETLTVYVGEDGENGDSSTAAVPEGGTSPFDGGVSGGDGGSGTGEGGAGAAPSALEDSSGTVLAVGAGGGGGGGGGGFSGMINENGGGGGGGGARGGAKGLGGTGSPGDGDDGQPGDGTGQGGDGGNGDDGTDGSNTATAGGAGGTVTDASLTDVTTSTSTSGPAVTLTDRNLPNRPTNLSIDTVNDGGFDISWTDDDSSPAGDNENGYRIYTVRYTSSGTTRSEVQRASLAANSTSYSITGLKNGERYAVIVEAFNDVGTARHFSIDAPSSGTTTVPSGTTVDNTQTGVAGTHEIKGTHETQRP